MKIKMRERSCSYVNPRQMLKLHMFGKKGHNQQIRRQSWNIIDRNRDLYMHCSLKNVFAPLCLQLLRVTRQTRVARKNHAYNSHTAVSAATESDTSDWSHEKNHANLKTRL